MKKLRGRRARPIIRSKNTNIADSTVNPLVTRHLFGNPTVGTAVKVISYKDKRTHHLPEDEGCATCYATVVGQIINLILEIGSKNVFLLLLKG